MTDIPDFGIHDYPRIVGRLPVAPHLRPKPRRVPRGNRRFQRFVRIPKGTGKSFVIDWVPVWEAVWSVEGEA